MGKKNWLFCWTELGAEHIGIAHSLIATCRMQHVDPYTYLVDVLQRIGQHPASKVAELTPRMWKERFANNPLRSDLYHIGRGNGNAAELPLTLILARSIHHTPFRRRINTQARL